MFPKHQRIRLNKEYEHVFTKGRGYHSHYVTLKTVRNDLAMNRFGIIVSNKTEKKAYRRNRIRRQVREILRTSQIHFQKNGFDLVFVIKKPLIELKEYAKIQVQIHFLLKKARFL